jgi:hypothetical protein
MHVLARLFIVTMEQIREWRNFLAHSFREFSTQSLAHGPMVRQNIMRMWQRLLPLWQTRRERECLPLRAFSFFSQYSICTPEYGMESLILSWVSSQITKVNLLWKLHHRCAQWCTLLTFQTLLNPIKLAIKITHHTHTHTHTHTHREREREREICFHTRINTVKMSILSNMFYRFNAILSIYQLIEFYFW